MVDSCFVERTPSGGGYVTNLGAISAGRRLNYFAGLERKGVRVIVYDGLNKANTRSETKGKLGYAVSFQRLFMFVCGLLPTSEVIEQALRLKSLFTPSWHSEKSSPML